MAREGPPQNFPYLVFYIDDLTRELKVKFYLMVPRGASEGSLPSRRRLKKD